MSAVIAALLACPPRPQRGASNADAEVPVRSAPGYVRAALPAIDIHTHLEPDATETILRLLDQRNIRYAVNLSAGIPGQGLEEALAQQQSTRGRLLPFCTLPWQRFVDVDAFAQASVAVLEQCARVGVRGLKIPKILGLGLRDLQGRRVTVDDPRLDPVFETAGRLHLTVLIHSGDPRAFFEAPTPANERWEELQAHPRWSFYGGDNPSFDQVLTEFERRVQRHPNTTFIGAHFGNCAEDPDRVARLLERAPNYYIDTSARVPEFGRHASARMRAFFLRWQARIVFGTDLGLGNDIAEWMLGSRGSELTTQADVDRFFTATWRYYEGREPSAENPTPIQGRWQVHPVGLPRAVLERIYGGNAARLLGLTWPPPEGTVTAPSAAPSPAQGPTPR